MTLTRLPTNADDLYALMGPEALLAHLRALNTAIARVTDLPAAASAGIGELEDALLEHLGRADPDALARELGRLEALEKRALY
ncbi:MAG TPA: hypothetical protein PK264_24530 [Hyphomicrobiaceae bacterium]|nr:hypothetical protein [Hyphomicrobiaceae bacterium]